MARALSQAPGTAVVARAFDHARAVASALWRGAPTILGAGLVAAAVGLAGTFLMPVRYTAETRVLVELREAAGDVGGIEIAGRPITDPAVIASQVQLIASPDVARHVIATLDLARKSEFDPLVEGRSGFTTLLSYIGLARDLGRMSAEERALEAYAERLAVEPVAGTRVVSVRFTSRSADTAAAVANAVVERTLELQARAKVERDRRAILHRQRTIEELRQQMATLTERIAVERARLGLPPLDTAGLPATPLGEVQRELAQLRREQDEYIGRAGLIREAIRAGRPVDAAALAQIPALRVQAEALAALKLEVDRQNDVLLPQHPRMRELRQQMADAETRIRTECERLARAAEAEAQRLATRGEALRRQLDDGRRRPGQPAAGAGDDPQRRLAEMEREFQGQRDMLDSLVQMHRATTARDAFDMRSADGRVVARAVPPTSPSEPRTLLIMALAAGLGLVIATGGVLGSALVARRTAPDDGLDALIAGVGAPRAEPGLAVARHAVAAPAPARSGGAKTLFFHGLPGGPRPAALALAFARKLSAGGARVVLVDLALDGSGVGAITGLGRAAGVSEYMAGRLALAAALHRDPASRVHIVPGGGALPRGADAARLMTLIEGLRETYDHVVVDQGCDPRAALLPGALADGVFLVHASAEARRTLDAARERLRAGGARVIETIPSTQPAAGG